MSAVAGFWDFRGGGDAAHFCASMLDAQSLYGSDAAGQARCDAIVLGRNAWHLLPEDGYDPPVLTGGGGGLLLAADLRIDNRSALGAELGLPAREAMVRSDSALLLAGMERWGEAVLDRLIGDFAFAFYDSRRRRLILARDPLGQRPLFWHRGPGFFAFSSMPQGLLALPALRAAANPDSAARFVASLAPLGQDSFHQGIARVQPGHVLTVSEDGLSDRRYWRPTCKPLGLKRFDDYVEAYRSLLDDAVACRLRGTGRSVAAHLSGGWDSSAVASTAATQLMNKGEALLAFTAVPRADHAHLAPPSRFADERALAAATAGLHANIRHRLIEHPGGSPVGYLDRTVRLFERPPFNLCNHDWLAAIRTAARDSGARVLLTGEIGNWTISAGPNTILAELIGQRRWAAWWRESGAMLRGQRARLRGVLAASFGPWAPTPLWRAAAGWSSAAEFERALQPAWREKLAPELIEQRFGRPSRPRSHFDRTAEALMQMDFGQYRKGVLGGWGIDKRDATADIRLIEFTLSLPPEMLIGRAQRRPLARAALADRLPAAVLEERQKGYQAADWHLPLTSGRGELRALIARIEAHPAAGTLIDTGRLRGWVDAMPLGGWERPQVIARYRIALLTALSAGHFVASLPA